MSTRTSTHAPSFPLGRLGAIGAAVAGASVAIVLAAWYMSSDGTTSRPGVSAPAAAQVSTSSRPVSNRSVSSPTIYIVGSAAEKTAVDADIEELARIRFATGESALSDSVFVATTDEDAMSFRAGIEEGNFTLIGLGLPLRNVVDLRGN